MIFRLTRNRRGRSGCSRGPLRFLKVASRETCFAGLPRSYGFAGVGPGRREPGTVTTARRRGHYKSAPRKRGQNSGCHGSGRQRPREHGGSGAVGRVRTGVRKGGFRVWSQGGQRLTALRVGNVLFASQPRKIIFCPFDCCPLAVGQDQGPCVPCMLWRVLFKE